MLFSKFQLFDIEHSLKPKRMKCASCLSLMRQSDTRWLCKYAGVHYFNCRLSSVIADLTKLTQSNSKKEASEAKGLLLQLRSFDVIFTLTLMEDLLPVINTLSEQLQSQSLDFVICTQLITSCANSLQQKRSDKY